MRDKTKLFNHFAEKTNRVLVVRKDPDDKMLDCLADLIHLENLPNAVADKPILLAEIEKLAAVAAGSLWSNPDEKKASRTCAKIERLVDLLHDNDILNRLNMELTPRVTGGLLKQIETALGYTVAPWTDTSVPRQVSITYTPPKLHAVHLAEAVAKALREYGVRVNSSKTGNLVKTLDAIKAATGFATNSRKSAAAVCGRNA